MKRLHLNVSLRMRILLLLVFPLSLISGAGVIWGYVDYRDTALEKAEQHYLQLARQQATEINARMVSVQAMVDMMANQISSHRWVKAEQLFTIGDDALATSGDIVDVHFAFLPSVSPTGKPYAPASVRQPDGTFAHTYIEGKEYLLYDDFLIPRLLKRGVWLDPSIGDVGDGQLECAYSAPFQWGGEITGTITASLPLESISQEIADLDMEGARGALVSRLGTIVAHPNSDYIMNETIYSLADWNDRPELKEIANRLVRGEHGIGEFRKIGQDDTWMWMVYAPVESTGWSFVMTVPKALIMETVHAEVFRSLLLDVLILVAVIALVMFLVCRIIRPVVVLSDVARQIAAGDIESARQALVPLDTRSSGDVQAKDEVLQLVVSMSEMTDRLGKLVGHVKTAAGSLDTSANTISGQTRDLEATTTEQAASTHQSIASAKQIAATSQILLETMTEVANATGETESAVGQSQEELSRIHQAMLNLESATTAMGGRLDHIAEHAEEIGGIIVTIIQIADRTNLLSLNAAIQAEEAGEHGRGFAVVAEEIRHLADQTAEATLQIESLIGEMQQAVTDGVGEMQQLAKQVGGDVRTVQATGEQIGHVIEQVQSLPDQFERVRSGMSEQVSAADQIVESMNQLGTGASQVVLALKQLNTISHQLAESSGGLSQHVRQFNVREEE